MTLPWAGSLLLTVGQELPDSQPIKYYGQELNTTTYNLARMNLMLHGVSFNNMTLSNADTLEGDWPDGPDEKGIDRPRSFDAVVANPPYSAHWDNNDTKLTRGSRTTASWRPRPRLITHSSCTACTI